MDFSTPQLAQAWAGHPSQGTHVAATKLPSSFPSSARSAVEEELYMDYPQIDPATMATAHHYHGLNHHTSAAALDSRRASVGAPDLLTTPAPSAYIFGETTLSPFSAVTPGIADVPDASLMSAPAWYNGGTVSYIHPVPSSSRASSSVAPGPPALTMPFRTSPSQASDHDSSRQLSLAARRRRPSMQPLVLSEPPSSLSAPVGLGVTRRGSNGEASVIEMMQLCDETKSLVPVMPPTPTTPLQYIPTASEGPPIYPVTALSYGHPVSAALPFPDAYRSPPNSTRSVPAQLPSPYYVEAPQPPHSAIGYGFTYTMSPTNASFPHSAYAPPPRPRSAPASPEFATEERFDNYLQTHNEMYGVQHQKRRQSAVDMIPRELMYSPEPVYNEDDYRPYPPEPIYSPSHLVEPSYDYQPVPPQPHSASYDQTRHTIPVMSRPAMSLPTTPVRPTASPRRASASPKKIGRRTGSGAPMFINFTSNDASKLLSGVAPSGSSKRKREGEDDLCPTSPVRRKAPELCGPCPSAVPVSAV